MLHFDLDQEYEDAKTEGSFARMLQDWLQRLSSPDPYASLFAVYLEASQARVAAIPGRDGA